MTDVHVASEPLRGSCDLADLNRVVADLFEMVVDGLGAATASFLIADREGAREVAANDRRIDDLHCEAEAGVYRALADRSISDVDLHSLIMILQIVPELERSGDLIEHIAVRAAQGLARQLTPSCRRLIERMGLIATSMWEDTAIAFSERDPLAAERLRICDDELDDLHVTLTEELAAGSLDVANAIEIGLVARFFERLGDHAVNVARRLQPLPTFS
jgi:phosphate transport system protein